MCLKLDNTFFVEVVWILCLIGIITASWYSIGSGMIFPATVAAEKLFGINLNIVYLFIFGLMLWALYNIRYPTEHKEVNKKSKRK